MSPFSFKNYLSFLFSILFISSISSAQSQGSAEILFRPNLHSFMETQASILFELPEAGPAYVAIGTTPDDLDLQGSVERNSRFARHNQILSNLVRGQTYYFQVIAGDDFELSSDTYFFTHPGADGSTAAALYEEPESSPTLTLRGEPSVSDSNQTSARISFSLPERGPAVIAFGTSGDNLDQQGSIERSSRYADHRQTLSNLQDGQEYFYRVIGGEDFELESQIFTFTHRADSPAQPVQTQTPDPSPSTGTSISTTTRTTRGPEQEGVGAGTITRSGGTIYVEVGGRGNGGSVDSPMGDIQRAFDSARPGTTIYVKAGNYGNRRLTLAGSGSAGSPIILEGYRNTPGDSPFYGEFDHTSSINPNLMPLLDGGSRSNGSTGIRIEGRFVAVKNFQVTRFRNGVMGSGSNHTVDNIVAVSLGDPNQFYHGHGIFMTGPGRNFLVRNSTVVNAGAQAFTLSGRDSIYENNRAYCDDNSTGHDSATDYYFYMFNSYDNIFRNNYIERVGGLDHGGHGFHVRGEGERNLIENNIAVGMRSGIMVRHDGVRNNVYRGNRIYGGLSGSRVLRCDGLCWGITVRDAAGANLFENNHIEGTDFGIVLTDTHEQGQGQGGSLGNRFVNTTIRNVDNSAIEYMNGHLAASAGDPDSLSSDDVFINTTVDRASVVIQADHRTRNISIRGMRIRNVPVWLRSRAPRTISEFRPSLSDIVVEDRRFSVP